MQNNFRPFSIRTICATFVCLALSGYAAHSFAWGQDGHTAIGVLAINQLQPDARRELEFIVGPLDEQAITKACTWPDKIRETEEWSWSASRHYINIPRGDFLYLESRDCPDKQCVTEAIKEYAVQLGDRQLSKEKRWQAFAWLCHLTGDLHQPMHAGFADDRGGNNFDIIFEDEQINLHGFWDFELINLYAGNAHDLITLLDEYPTDQAASNWSSEMVNDWTNESHELAKTMAYPTTKKVNEAYLQQSWKLVQKQIPLASSRLALIINSELDDGH